MGEGADPSASGFFFGGQTFVGVGQTAFPTLTPTLRPPNCDAFIAGLRESPVQRFEALYRDNRALELCPGARQIAVDTYAADPYPSFPVGSLRGTRGLTPSQQQLAEALIASGQLTLGPSAFESPDAREALGMALAAASTATRSPTGGSMSAPFFGLGGASPGGTTPIMPFGLPFQAGGGFSFAPTGDAAGGGGGSIFGTLLNTGANVALQLFAQRQEEKAREEAFKQQLALLQAGAMAPPALGFAGPLLGNILSGMAGGAAGSLAGMLAEGAFGTGGGFPGAMAGACGARGAVTVTPMDAAALYSVGCSGRPQTRNRFFALRPDGTRDLFVKVGKVQSVSPRVLTRFARRWAKEAGLTTTKRGAKVGARRRRRPR